MTSPAGDPLADDAPATFEGAPGLRRSGDGRMEGVSSSRHSAHLARSVPSLPKCTWCGYCTGFYCEGWRPHGHWRHDSWRFVEPTAHSRVQDMAFGWGCGLPLCIQCDKAFSCCIKCYCYKGDMNAEQARNIHSLLLKSPHIEADSVPEY